MNWELTGKRLLALGYLGAHIEYSSGHRWLKFTNSEVFGGDPCLLNWMKENSLDINIKQYGGVESILDTIDYALKKMGKNALIEYFESLDGMGYIAGEEDMIGPQTDRISKFKWPKEDWEIE